MSTVAKKEDQNLDTAEYILAIKIKSTIYQAIIETQNEKNKRPDFVSLDELAVAVAADTLRNLKQLGLIEFNPRKEA